MRLVGFLLCCAIGGTLASSQTIDPRDRAFWNGKFGDPKSAFNHQPSRLLVEALDGRHPGDAIDLGMGEGRNALYLAQRGWRVTGVDLSNVGVAQAKRHASELGVRLDTAIDNLDHYDFGHARWDLIALFYMHAWFRGASPRSAERIRDALRPGGLLIIEGFAGDEKYMFQTNELLRDFSDLKILRYEDTQAEADWAPGQKSHIIRLVAEKRM
jgi:SAM-dependent methyltransferase